MLRQLTVVLTAILFLWAEPAAGQSVWVNSQREEAIGVEWHWFDARDVRGPDHPSAFSSAMFISGKLELDPGLYLVGELPLSHWQYVDDDGPDAQDPHTTVGNIYLGAEWYLSSPSKNGWNQFLELGLRFRSMPQPDFPDQRGYYSGYLVTTERRDAFRTDFMPLHAYLNNRLRLNEHISFRLRTGLSYWLYRGDRPDNPENRNIAYIHYGGIFAFESEYIDSSVGILGQYWFFHQPDGIDHVPASYEAAVQLQYNTPRFSPGIFLKTPINSPLIGEVNQVFGITAEIPLR